MNEVPIKSNQAFIFEWWNIFFQSYSDQLVDKFTQDNKEVLDAYNTNVSIGNVLNQKFQEHLKEIARNTTLNAIIPPNINPPVQFWKTENNVCENLQPDANLTQVRIF